MREVVIPLTASENYGAGDVHDDVIQDNRLDGHRLEFDGCACGEAVRRMIAAADVLVAHHQTIATHRGRTQVTTTATYADQRDEFNAALAQQAPAEVLEGFGRIIADQAAVDYAARAPKVGDHAP